MAGYEVNWLPRLSQLPRNSESVAAKEASARTDSRDRRYAGCSEIEKSEESPVERRGATSNGVVRRQFRRHVHELGHRGAYGGPPYRSTPRRSVLRGKSWSPSVRP